MPSDPRSMSSHLCSAVTIALSRNEMKKLRKFIRPNREHPREPAKPEVDPDFLGHSELVALKNSKMVSLTSKTCEMKKELLCTKKSFHFIIFAVKVLINFTGKKTFDLFKVKVLD